MSLTFSTKGRAYFLFLTKDAIDNERYISLSKKCRDIYIYLAKNYVKREDHM